MSVLISQAKITGLSFDGDDDEIILYVYVVFVHFALCQWLYFRVLVDR